ncbi:MULTISPECIES: hypothetical protein [unclassified Actinopolyspora]|uniref:hypothetical protein n=1 Tax=unclassified Actinopolyspora TaxID=2639451 RepID=UPI0013F5B75F|nr:MULTISPECIES: hypothetical protein [unclassified Actinopolyspora]NHD17806.1 hypothetical protein [Actinopolyspora sp. BKK2]NHE77679.1 hypothetical protein [Actinopolyspora sp. BKK1]
MFPNPYDERDDVFWIVGLSTDVRHATEVIPGAHPPGEWVPTLCQHWIRLPFPTPAGRVPTTAAIQRQCPRCGELAEQRGCSGVIWDF